MNLKPADDPLINIVHQQIKGGIRTCLAGDHLGSALILIYSAIDTMAHLSRPPAREDVKATDFIDWCEKYIPLCTNRLVTGEELYSARCGIVHTYGIDSRRTRHGACRLIGYTDRMEPPVRFDPAIDRTFALVSVAALANGLFSGIDEFLVRLFSDPQMRRAAEERLERLYVVYNI